MAQKMTKDVILIRVGDTGTPQNAAKHFLQANLGVEVTVLSCKRLGRYEGGVWRYEVEYEVVE